MKSLFFFTNENCLVHACLLIFFPQVRTLYSSLYCRKLAMLKIPCCDETKVRKGLWSLEVDATLKNYIQNYGTGGNWITFPQKAGHNSYTLSLCVNPITHISVNACLWNIRRPFFLQQKRDWAGQHISIALSKNLLRVNWIFSTRIS